MSEQEYCGVRLKRVIVGEVAVRSEKVVTGLVKVALDARHCAGPLSTRARDLRASPVALSSHHDHFLRGY